MEDETPERDTYHHGNLRKALVEATLKLIEEQGPDAVTVADAGKRAGVSSGAPFRHFATKKALMTAVAEALQEELMEKMEEAFRSTPPTDPWEALQKMGLAYLRWGIAKPHRLRTLSNRNLYEREASPILVQGDERLTELVEGSFARLFEDDQGARDEARRLNVQARSLLTGLVTLFCNGQFTTLGLPDEPVQVTIEDAWFSFLEALKAQRSQNSEITSRSARGRAATRS